MNVFISSASRKVALVQSFVDAVAQLPMKGKVYAADVNPLSAALYTKAEPVISPKSNDPNYAAWLLEFCKQNEIRLIIPTRDEELELFAQLSPRFKKEGILINISSPETVNTCNDKRKFYDYCNANGFPVPTVYSSQSTITFPCFIKGRFGKGARFAFKIEDAAQLNAFSSIAGETIISEFVDWREYTVDYFADFKGTPISVVPRLRVSTFGGESFVGCTESNKTIIEAAINLGSRLPLFGHNTIQLFYEPKSQEIKFIEINPRFGGGAALGIAAGADTPAYLLQCAANQTVSPRIGDFTDHLYMLRHTEDIFVNEAQLRR